MRKRRRSSAMSVKRQQLIEVLQGPDPLGYQFNPLPEAASDGADPASQEAQEALRSLGFASVAGHAAYLALDTRQIARRLAEKAGAKLYTLQEALQDPRLARHAWSLISPLQDRYTAAVALAEQEGIAEGYAVHIPRGARVKAPIYACMLVTRKRGRQLLHNIIVLEEDSEATIVTGCGAAPTATAALHVGVTEIIVGPRARLNYVMVHSWAPGSHVRPRTAALVGEEGSLVTYYVLHGRLGSLHSKPRFRLMKGAKLYSATIVSLSTGHAVAGAEAELLGPGATAELASRILASGDAHIESPLRLAARAAAKGHVECMGIPLSPGAVISSTPSLEASVEDAELSHEAAIGKLREEELEYLEARGLSEEAARRLLLQGILHVEPPGLPPQVRSIIKGVEAMLARSNAA